MPTDRNMILQIGFFTALVRTDYGGVVRGTFQENVVVPDFGYRDLFYLKVSWLSLG